MTARRRFYPPTISDLPLHSWRPYSEVHRERISAHEKHDDAGGSMERKSFDDPAWLPVLVEEVGEVASALCEFRHLKTNDVALAAALRSELVQVAAMAVAWIDAIDLDRRLR